VHEHTAGRDVRSIPGSTCRSWPGSPRAAVPNLSCLGLLADRVLGAYAAQRATVGASATNAAAAPDVRR
jgi:hypothetical protein